MSDDYKNPFESGSGEWQTEAPAEEPAEVSADVATTESFAYQEPNAGSVPPTGKKKSNGFAVASLSLGIASLALCLLCCCFTFVSWGIAIVCGALGVTFGIISIVKNGKSANAIVGLVLGAIAVLLSFILIIVFAFIATNHDLFIDYMRQTFPEFEEYYNEMGFAGAAKQFAANLTFYLGK